jgi:hypothetical protein
VFDARSRDDVLVGGNYGRNPLALDNAQVILTNEGGGEGVSQEVSFHFKSQQIPSSITRRNRATTVIQAPYRVESTPCVVSDWLAYLLNQINGNLLGYEEQRLARFGRGNI